MYKILETVVMSLVSFNYVIHISCNIFCAGQFTCKVQDWNETKVKSLEVTVLKRPHIQVLPLSVSVLKDAPILCTCLSRDDKTGDFVYTWWKDNEILIAGPNDEVVEDLYPTGSRIRVRSAQVSAVYTCEVENPSGKSREECHLSVSPCKFCKNSLACMLPSQNHT